MVTSTRFSLTLNEHCLSCYLSDGPPVTFWNRQSQRWYNLRHFVKNTGRTFEQNETKTKLHFRPVIQTVCCAMLPLETFPYGDPSGRVVYLLNVLSPEQASLMWVFLNKSFLQGVFISTSPNPQAGGPPPVCCLRLLIILFAATLLIRGRSSIRNLKMSHAMVAGTHYMDGWHYFPLIRSFLYTLIKVASRGSFLYLSWD